MAGYAAQKAKRLRAGLSLQTFQLSLSGTVPLNDRILQNEAHAARSAPWKVTSPLSIGNAGEFFVKQFEARSSRLNGCHNKVPMSLPKGAWRNGVVVLPFRKLQFFAAGFGVQRQVPPPPKGSPYGLLPWGLAPWE